MIKYKKKQKKYKYRKKNLEKILKNLEKYFRSFGEGKIEEKSYRIIYFIS